MEKRYKILYVEDDETLAYLTKDNLELNGYDVVRHAGGKTVMTDFAIEDYDLCLLDIMLPGKDGFELAADIRAVNSQVPIIFLSAKTLKEDRIRGLKTGADDYLVKPFSIEELVLKIEIFLQRSKKNASANHVFRTGIFSFDSLNYEVRNGDERTILTRREAELLKLFLQNVNRVLKREDILKALWGTDDYFLGRSLDVFISRLRKILSKDSTINIENLHGIGFRYGEKKTK